MSDVAGGTIDKLAEPFEKITPVEYQLYNDEKERIYKENCKLDAIESSCFSDMETKGANWYEYNMMNKYNNIEKLAKEYEERIKELKKYEYNFSYFGDMLLKFKSKNETHYNIQRDKYNLLIDKTEKRIKHIKYLMQNNLWMLP